MSDTNWLTMAVSHRGGTVKVQPNGCREIRWVHTWEPEDDLFGTDAARVTNRMRDSITAWLEAVKQSRPDPNWVLVVLVLHAPSIEKVDDTQDFVACGKLQAYMQYREIAK